MEWVLYSVCLALGCSATNASRRDRRSRSSPRRACQPPARRGALARPAPHARLAGRVLRCLYE